MAKLLDIDSDIIESADSLRMAVASLHISSSQNQGENELNYIMSKDLQDKKGAAVDTTLIPKIFSGESSYLNSSIEDPCHSQINTLSKVTPSFAQWQSPFLESAKSSAEPCIEVVGRCNENTSKNEILSDIFVVPCAKKLQSPVRVVNINSVNLPFLADGRHRLWAPCEASHNKLERYEDQRLLSEIDDRRQRATCVETTNCEEKGYYAQFGKWRELLLGAQFYATIPQVLNAYIQMLFNLIIVCSSCYCLWYFLVSLRGDILVKLTYEAKQLATKASECRSEYERNRCDPNHRVPAMEQLCNNWHLCMETANVNSSTHSAALSAETLGHALNTFMEQLTWKSVILLAIGVAFILFFSNLLLSFSRLISQKYASASPTKESLSINASDSPRYRYSKENTPSCYCGGRAKNDSYSPRTLFRRSSSAPSSPLLES